MRRKGTSVSFLAVVSTALLSVMAGGGSAAAGPLGVAQDGPDQAVIVIMRNQRPDLKPKAQAEQRQQAVDSDQKPVVDDLKAHGASKIEQLTTVSAVAATAKPDEVRRLQADPQVAAVVPDRTLISPLARNNGSKAKGPKLDQRICPPDPGRPLLEPEALDLTHTESQDPHAQQAHSIATGKGVKVAYVADGIDVNNPDFVRPDGSHVFFDFQDFSGDGVNDDSGGGEAFGDASSIAAQGNRVYDLSTELPFSGLPAGCTIRIRGMAPDSSMAGIKTFGQFGATTSGFVRGIDYAVNHDKVDILSESFGSNPYPDTSLDPISLANQAALDAGVTVVASTGDSGIGGTTGSPASDPRFIAVAGTTSYRLSAQAKGYTGWVNNNITGLSSGGPTLNNRLPDLVAPAFGGMADCTVDPTKWGDCVSLTEPFGGTSQSAPLVAGAAALVIQAYADSHNGRHPAPELVKKILTGTATDLNTPSGEQGAGLVNSYQAVLAAKAIDGGHGQGGNGLVPSTTQLNLIGTPGSTQHGSVTLTNTSSQPQVVTQTSRELGGPTWKVTKNEQVTGTAPAAGNPPAGPAEGPEAAPSFTFNVPNGTPFFDTSMVWQGTRTSGQLVIELFDPKGRLVQESYDYGFTDFQHIDVHDPVPGTWTAKILWGNGRGHYQEPVPTPGTFRGPISVQITGHDWTSFGGGQAKVVPAGGSAAFDVSVPLPAQAGDRPAALQFDTNLGTHLSVPVARRSLIPAVDNATFNATITGGVGRVLGQSLGYYLDVPAGKSSLTLDLTSPDPATTLVYYLVSPDGQILSVDTNVTDTKWGDASSAKPTNTASITANQPAAGRWQLIVSLPGNVAGKEFSEQVTGRVHFNGTTARPVNLPNSPSTKIKAGQTVTASIEVTNTGAAGQWFFLDPRLTGEAGVKLTPSSGDTAINLPEDQATTHPPTWWVPTHTSKLSETVAASAPVDVDLFPFAGNPETFKKAGNGHNTVDTALAKQLATGNWATDIAEVGPFPNGAPAATANVSATAQTMPFDAAAHGQTGDIWLEAVGGGPEAPVYVVPGVSRNITLAITPSAPAGTVVHGVVYVDTFNPEVANGSELVGIPYSYTVG
ncbi:S8 family serine peptidase [Actinocrispum wychmicini]|uniref:Subtilase family protein n=1 Tax=Actinocrispum wychmicini TaxID=1213861 RepID=A0A4V2S6A1_9PSEU|nr:S8 family serine peptidase [Actinocrispum wychmicini]TCO54900.1 subtilase family protein [Actinocrispum wychmicini]